MTTPLEATGRGLIIKKGPELLKALNAALKGGTDMAVFCVVGKEYVGCTREYKVAITDARCEQDGAGFYIDFGGIHHHNPNSVEVGGMLTQRVVGKYYPATQHGEITPLR